MVSYSRKEIPSSLDLLPLGERFGDKNKAKNRALPNAKFAHIKSSIDHGKKEKPQVVTSKDTILTRRRGENFGRIAPQTLVNYISDGQAAAQLSTQLDDLQILRTGRYPTKRPPAETTRPKIVLLDLRSQAEFLSGHIRNAISFPAEHIQRDQVFAQLSVYKNKPDKLLVVYHEDERHGILQCRIIFEKGFDNVYLLSGGICIFEQEHPNLIDMPVTPRVPNLHATSDSCTPAGAMAAATSGGAPPQQRLTGYPREMASAATTQRTHLASARMSTAHSFRQQRNAHYNK